MKLQSRKSIGELSAEGFEKVLIDSVQRVAQAHERAGGIDGNRAWTQAQWRELTTLLLQYSPQEPDSWLWFGYHRAAEDFTQKPEEMGHAYLEAGGEWLYDYSFVEYLTPSGASVEKSKWEHHRFGELIVAAESEWDSTFGALEHDFEKLLVSRARFKVFFCDPGSKPETRKKAKLRLAESLSGGLLAQDTRLWLVTWSRSSEYTVERLVLEPSWVEVAPNRK
ncbi:MAG: hypothetical protein RIA71_01985 [Oceanicaulis sp.]